MSTNAEILARIPAFQQVSLPMLRHLAEAATIVKYQPGNVFYDQGSTLTGLYGINSGYVKLFRQSEERRQILALLRFGDCFGTEALSESATSSYSAAAITETIAIFMPADEVRYLLEINPEFRIVLLQLVTVRLRQLAALVHNLAFRDVKARLALVLVTRADEDGTVTADGIRVPRLMTQSELATMVGTGREVVHRTFKKFEAAGIMHISRKEIIIPDIDRLRKIALDEQK